MISCVAVTDRPRSRRVVSNHASDRAHVATGWVGRESAADFPEPGVQGRARHAGLNTGGVGADFADGSKMLAEIDNESCSESFARQSRARAARNQREAMLLRITHKPTNILLVQRHNDTGGLDLKNARIRAIQPARNLIEKNLSLEETLQVIF